MVEVEGSIAVFSSEHSGDCGVLELSTEDGPLVTESDHILDILFLFILE